jgi:hypothetical protein
MHNKSLNIRNLFAFFIFFIFLYLYTRIVNINTTEDIYSMEVKSDTPLSVLLYLHPEAESVLKEHFNNIDFSSITERIKTLEDISKEENIEVKTIIEDLNKRLDT